MHYNILLYISVCVPSMMSITLTIEILNCADVQSTNVSKMFVLYVIPGGKWCTGMFLLRL